MKSPELLALEAKHGGSFHLDSSGDVWIRYFNKAEDRMFVHEDCERVKELLTFGQKTSS